MVFVDMARVFRQQLNVQKWKMSSCSYIASNNLGVCVSDVTAGLKNIPGQT